MHPPDCPLPPHPLQETQLRGLYDKYRGDSDYLLMMASELSGGWRAKDVRKLLRSGLGADAGGGGGEGRGVCVLEGGAEAQGVWCEGAPLPTGMGGADVCCALV